MAKATNKSSLYYLSNQIIRAKTKQLSKFINSILIFLILLSNLIITNVTL
jgi:hypothetical protein